MLEESREKPKEEERGAPEIENSSEEKEKGEKNFMTEREVIEFFNKFGIQDVNFVRKKLEEKGVSDFKFLNEQDDSWEALGIKSEKDNYYYVIPRRNTAVNDLPKRVYSFPKETTVPRSASYNKIIHPAKVSRSILDAIEKYKDLREDEKVNFFDDAEKGEAEIW